MADFLRLEKRQFCLHSFTSTWQIACTEFCLSALGWPGEHGLFSPCWQATSSIWGGSLTRHLDPPSFEEVLLDYWRRWNLMFRLAGRDTKLHKLCIFEGFSEYVSDLLIFTCSLHKINYPIFSKIFQKIKLYINTLASPV